MPGQAVDSQAPQALEEVLGSGLGWAERARGFLPWPFHYMAAKLLEKLVFDGLKDLSTKFVGRPFYYFPSVSSTMDVARELALNGAPEGTTVVTDEQTAGRGRLGRRWITPSGTTLALSVILRPTSVQFSRLTMVGGLAVVQAIEETTSLRPTLKWPNDVLIKGKKVGGLLVEGSYAGPRLDFAVLGIGVNVTLNVALHREIAQTATSLARETGQPVSKETLLWNLLPALENRYLASAQGDDVLQAWQKRLETLGQKVTVTMGAQVEEGIAEGVDELGHLLLRRDDGLLLRLAAGDVSLGRVS